MRGLSLFSGCGGLDLAAEAAGIVVAGQCEIDKHCVAVLEQHWPDVYRWRDVDELTGGDVHRQCGAVDIVFGGPPCQPVSVAGRRGAAGDQRNKWPAFLRLVREIGPRWIVAENPTGILSAQRFLGDERKWPKGEFFGEIVREITSLGYCCGWGVWGACDVGAPHKRERVFLVAHRQGFGWLSRRAEQSRQQREPGFMRGGAVGDAGGAGWEERDAAAVTGGQGYFAGACDIESLGDAECAKWWAGEPAGDVPDGPYAGREQAAGGVGGAGENGGTPIRVLPERGLDRAAHGPSDWVHRPLWPAGRGCDQYPWEPPRVVPSGTSPGRAQRLKMLGNAVVPAQAVILFEAIYGGGTSRRGEDEGYGNLRDVQIPDLGWSCCTYQVL